MAALRATTPAPSLDKYRALAATFGPIVFEQEGWSATGSSTIVGFARYQLETENRAQLTVYEHDDGTVTVDLMVHAIREFSPEMVALPYAVRDNVLGWDCGTGFIITKATP